jgi:hypothetical protein
VPAALELGWELADLYAGAPPTPVSAELPATLPGAADLAPGQRRAVAIATVATLITRTLGDGERGPTTPDSKAVAGPTTAGLEAVADGDASAWRRGIYDLHLELLASLGGRGAGLARGYELGRSLADTARAPHDLGVLIDRLDPARLLPIEAALADLGSEFPPHAAAAVAATIEQWKRWAEVARARENMDLVRGALARQRALWRALLSGEKDARQMLDPDAMVAASVRHASRLGTMARGVAGAHLPVMAPLAVAAFLVLYTIIDRAGIATVVAALGALAATLIAIRKWLVLTVEDTLGQVRPRLWGAELNAAVGQAILRLPPGPPAAQRSRLALVRGAAVGHDGHEPATGTGAAAAGAGAVISHHVERAMRVTRSARKQGLRVPASGPGAAISAEPAPELEPEPASELPGEIAISNGNGANGSTADPA